MFHVTGDWAVVFVFEPEFVSGAKVLDIGITIMAFVVVECPVRDIVGVLGRALGEVTVLDERGADGWGWRG